MTPGELEARILDADRAQASAPPDVSRDLRLSAQAEADAWQQTADAHIRHDPAGSANATALTRHMAANASSSKPRTPFTRRGLPAPAA